MTSYEFEQMVAEAKAKLGTELVTKILRSTAAEFGWPLSPEGRTELLYQLAICCRGLKTAELLPRG
jgi:hypothetical protein